MNNENFPTIPNYQIESEIGQGGMAVVYKGQHISLDRPVAIKLLKPDMVSNKVAISRFLKEPTILARFTHPNIVTVYDSGFLDEQQQQRYLVMEYLPGATLKQKMRQGRLSPREIIDVMTAVTRALKLAHESGVIHRDIKPDNILFRENGTPVLTDFGIAKDLDSHTATAAGTLLGTYRYMSPEQFQGLELDGRSDLYSLGILLVESLTGQRPFDGSSFEMLLARRLTEPAPTLPPDAGEFQQIVDRLLQKDLNRRFDSATELLAALEALEIELGLAEASSDTGGFSGDYTTVTQTAAESVNREPAAVDEPARMLPTDKVYAAVVTPPPDSGKARRDGRCWLAAGFAVAVLALVGGFIVPPLWDVLQIRQAEAAVAGLKTELSEQENKQQQEFSGVEGILRRIEQEKQQLEARIIESRQQHARLMQQQGQEKAKLDSQLQQLRATAEQTEARNTKERSTQENNIQELNQQLAKLQQETAEREQQMSRRIEQLNAEEQQLRQQLQQNRARAQQQQQQAEQKLAAKQSALAGLQQQLSHEKQQNEEKLAELTKPQSNNAVLWAGRILQIEPARPEAHAIIGEVIDKYLDWKNLSQAGELERYFSAAQLQKFIELGGESGPYLNELIIRE